MQETSEYIPPDIAALNYLYNLYGGKEEDAESWRVIAKSLLVQYKEPTDGERINILFNAGVI